MEVKKISLQPGKSIFFASDFHLGAPNPKESLIRERKIIKWLDYIKNDAQEVYILGDVFDFWYEYKYVVPKGYFRFLAKIAEIREAGIPVIFFKGNHDMWMKDYLEVETGVEILDDTLEMEVNGIHLQIGHGDGLGPGDHVYKILRKIFRNKFSQWLFTRFHPNFSFWIAKSWSAQSRLHNEDDKEHLGDKEMIYQHCLEQEKIKHRDYYIFGHRHLPMQLDIGPNSKYINLGEWIEDYTYAVLNGKDIELKQFD